MLNSIKNEQPTSSGCTYEDKKMIRNQLWLWLVLFPFIFSNSASGSMLIGSVAGQDGWSGGAASGLTNNGAQPSSPNSDLFYNGDWHGEAVTTAEARTGNQSWLLRNGYDSPGSGTPFSPSLAVPAGQPSSGAIAHTFSASFWFKAAGGPGDGSRIMIAGGNPTGNDRSSNYLEIENSASGITVRAMEGIPGGGWSSTEKIIAAALDTTVWHKLTMVGQFFDGPSNDIWTYRINDGSETTTSAYFETARDHFGYGYELTNRLKFQPRHANYDPSAEGFYFDDLVTTTSGASGTLSSYATGFEIPEPSTGVMVGLGLLGLVASSRKCRKRIPRNREQLDSSAWENERITPRGP